MFTFLSEIIVHFGILAGAALIAYEARALILGVMAALKHPDVMLSQRLVKGLQVTEFVPGKISGATRRKMVVNAYFSRSIVCHEVHFTMHKRKPNFKVFPAFFLISSVGALMIGLGVDSSFEQFGFSMAAGAGLFLSTQARRCALHSRKYEARMTEIRGLMLKAVST